jgi:hypothetical protein
MPVLPSQRHELFAHAIVKGLTPVEAYRKANFTGKTVNACSSHILNKPEVANRISELHAQTAEVFVRGNIANRNYRLAVLNEIVSRLMERFRQQAVPNTGEVRETRECLKQAAIESGQWEEKQQITLQAADNDFSKLSEEQIQSALAKMQEARAMLNALPGIAEVMEDSGSLGGEGCVIQVGAINSGS